MNIKTIVVTVVLTALAASSFAAHNVRGYIKRDGTYVKPHKSSDPYEAKSTGCHYHDNVKYCS